MNSSISNSELETLLRKDLKLFENEPFSSNTLLAGDNFYIDKFAHLSISYSSQLKGDTVADAFVNAVSQAIWYKPIKDSSWRLGSYELKRGSSITIEPLRRAVLKRYNQVISKNIYSKYF